MSSGLPPISRTLLEQLAREFDEHPRYGADEKALSWLVSKSPKNDDLSAVLLKVVAVNGLYSTQVYAVFEVAKHITELSLDRLLDQGGPEPVEAVAHVVLAGKLRRLYSFGSKYCSWHRPETYPIMDGIVRDLLWAYRSQFDPQLRRGSMDTYRGYCAAPESFTDHFGLAAMSPKEIDKGLWLLGKRRREVG